MRRLPMTRIARLAAALACLTPCLVFAQSTGDGWWRTEGNRILDAAGNPVRFSGVNWHGMDSENRIMHGLWGGTGRTIERHLDEMKALGFNLIRLPFSSQILAPGAAPLQTAIDPAVNADLLGKTCLEILDRLVASAGQRGIRIILDYHRLRGGGAPEPGHWYDATVPESQWIANWKGLVGRYRTDPTVVGVDLFNEVHDGVTWEADGVNPAHNWRWAAKRCGNEILSVNPNLLICVQGLDQYQGEAGWWGAVHLGVRDHPLSFDVPNRLVYEIHDYGPIVWDQTFHQYSAGFPNNLPAHWDRQWGFLHNEAVAPVWVGEWGALMDPSRTEWPADKHEREALWLEKLRAYIQQKGLSWTWWCWTPESRDTGGIIKNDYSGFNTNKVTYLQPVQYPGFAPSGGGTLPPPPGPTPGQTPYGGTARAIPGTLQAEDFDEGGEGVAYHDIDAANQGGQYRTTGVDVEATGDTGGGYNVGWLAPGEWLEFTVDVATAGSYSIDFRVASAMGGGTMHLESAGANLTGTVAAPDTGGWQAWTTVTAASVSLAAGPQEIRLAFDSGSFNLNSMTFTLLSAGGGGGAGTGGGGGSDGSEGCGLTGLEGLFALAWLRFRLRRACPVPSRRSSLPVPQGSADHDFGMIRFMKPSNTARGTSPICSTRR
jgi:endoglucanase